jgi:hypothetical protein
LGPPKTEAGVPSDDRGSSPQALVRVPNIVDHMHWSEAGPIPGLVCGQISESADIHAWNDNFLCVDPSWAFAFVGVQYSSAGPIADKICTQLLEPSDPDTWDDNYLCFPADWNLVWSSAGPLPGHSCVQIFEHADPDTWDDNYLCTPIEYEDSCDPICN